MDQVKNIQKSYEELMAKAQALEGKVSSLQKTKASLEKDIEILADKKHTATGEVADLDSTVRDAVKVALARREKELDELVDSNKSHAESLSRKSAAADREASILAKAIEDNKKQAEALQRDTLTCKTLATGLHATKDRLLKLTEHIIEVVKNA